MLLAQLVVLGWQVLQVAGFISSSRDSSALSSAGEHAARDVAQQECTPVPSGLGARIRFGATCTCLARALDLSPGDWYAAVMPSFATRKTAPGLLALCLLCACGDDAQDTRDAATDAAPTTDAATGADAGGPLLTLLQADVLQYDRRVRAVCPCEVASAMYKNEKECLDYGLSGPDWAQCAAKALTGHDSAATRAGMQCLMDYLQQAAECTEAAACDNGKLAQCGTPSSDCLAKASMGINLILAACPDFGLLSRLGTPENDRDE